MNQTPEQQKEIERINHVAELIVSPFSTLVLVLLGIWLLYYNDVARPKLWAAAIAIGWLAFNGFRFLSRRKL